MSAVAWLAIRWRPRTTLCAAALLLCFAACSPRRLPETRADAHGEDSAAGASAASAEAGALAGSNDAARRVEQLLGQLTLGREPRRTARDELLSMGPSVIPLLAEHFDSPEFTVRWEIANMLGILAQPAAVEPLVEQSLGDADTHIRWRSLWALSQIPDDSIGERFRSALSSEDEARRWHAHLGAAMFGVREALGGLQEGVNHPDPFHAWSAVNALGLIPDPTSVAVLRSALESDTDRLRREAVQSLGKMTGLPGVTEVLLGALDDADPGVRWRAARFLSRNRTAAVTEALERRLQVETDDLVIQNLERSLSLR
jgi:HEAT repeat protein